jgi:phospholipid-binding lipoprotein MlaA
MSSSPSSIVALVLIAFLATACSSIPPEQRVESDPWESLNRPLYSVHSTFDNVLTKPIAKGYRKIMPGPVRKGVSNFFRNLNTPRSIINNLLQGKPQRGFSEFGRLLFNSTLGIGGLIDIAALGGMEEYREDFGQTAAVWGVPDGPFVVLPFLVGPQTLRDALLLPLDIIVDPLYQYDNSSIRTKLYVVRLIDLRYRLLTASKFLDDSKDPYLTTRESYLQNREYEVYDGDPPLDDDFFDEFLDEQ